MLSSGGVVGEDEPLQVGSSSRKRLCGLTDSSEWGSGQCPKALRENCDFHQFSVIFPTREEINHPQGESIILLIQNKQHICLKPHLGSMFTCLATK